VTKATVATILGTVICLAALAAWFVTAPAVGSGWILFVAFLGALGILNSTMTGQAIVASLIMTVGSGFAWWFHRGLPNSGWVLCLCILCAIVTSGRLAEANGA
jgi:hypothetical protein